MRPCEGACFGGCLLWIAWLVTPGLGAWYFVGACIHSLLWSPHEGLCVRSPEGSRDWAPSAAGLGSLRGRTGGWRGQRVLR